ncbi:MAG: hypothetical protein IJL50_08820 [Bacteroidaceae bacterium]|nr:hypothetical protein [Bacteroidaceae bacterium]
MEIRRFSKRPSGSRKNEPKVMSVVLEDFFRSNEPLAVAFRHRYVNTELNVDLKLLTQKPGRMPEGKCLEGILAHDKEDRYVFTEMPLQAARRRNPQVFNGRYITITQRRNGTYRVNMKPVEIGGGFDVDGYALGVCNELLLALGCLVGEK